jgi:hypothetical protein
MPVRAWQFATWSTADGLDRPVEEARQRFSPTTASGGAAGRPGAVALPARAASLTPVQRRRDNSAGQKPLAARPAQDRPGKKPCRLHTEIEQNQYDRAQARERRTVDSSMLSVGRHSATAVVDDAACLGIDPDHRQPGSLPGLDTAFEVRDVRVTGGQQLVRCHQRALAGSALQDELAPRSAPRSTSTAV